MPLAGELLADRDTKGVSKMGPVLFSPKSFKFHLPYIVAYQTIFQGAIFFGYH